MHNNFHKAKENISKRFDYLILIDYNGCSEIATFLDKEYGEFKAVYNTVYSGQKNHKKRAYKSRINKTKITNLEKYGVENISQSKENKEKIKKYNLEKYGVENISQINKVKQKKKETCLKNYGVDVPIKSKIIQEKIEQTNLKRYGVKSPQQNKYIREKTKKTNIIKYGYTSPLHNHNIILKIKQNYFNKYGVDHYKKSKFIKSKTIKNNLEKFGVKHLFQLDNVKNKIIHTNLIRYGVKYPLQNLTIRNKGKQTKLLNNSLININGYSLLEFYNKSNIKNIRSYNTVYKNYKTYGNAALKEDHYNLLHGKSKIADLWLENIEKELGYNLIREYHIPTTRYHADGYDPNTNTIYEFYGDYWHGNLNKFDALTIHPTFGITYKSLYFKTINRKTQLIDLGFNIIDIWELDFPKGKMK